MNEKNLMTVEAYYKALNDKNLSAIAQCLHPNVKFLGAMASIAGKEEVLEGVKRLLPLFNDLTIRAKFAAGNQVMLAYDLNCFEPIGTIRVAALISLEETNLISGIELFFDPRAFEKSSTK
jgi:hypothetical protein